MPGVLVSDRLLAVTGTMNWHHQHPNWSKDDAVQRRTWWWAVALAAAFVVGIGVGAGGSIVVVRQTADQPVTVASYEMSTDDLGRTELRAWVTTGGGPVFTLWVVREKSDRVEVSVREQRPAAGSHTLEAVLTRLSWPLTRPLGSRQVVDTATGNVIPPS